MTMSKPIRQHPLMMVLGFIDQLKSLVLPVALFFLIDMLTGDAQGFRIIYVILPLSFAGIGVLYAILQWIFYTYDYQDGVLYIRQGIFVKKLTTIKKERIQTINIEAGIIHRVFKLVRLNIETAGNLSDSELAIQAMDKASAYQLKAALEGELRSENALAESGYKVTADRLFFAGITSGGVGIIMLVMIGFASQFIVLLPDHIWDNIFAQGAIVITIIVILFVISSWFISIVRYVIRYAYFTIIKDHHEFNIKRGLIQQKLLSLKEHRIQSINIIEGLLRQPFRYQAIEVDVAGGSAYKESTKTVTHPFIHNDELNDYFEYAFDDYQYEKALNQLPKRALKRYLFRATVPFIVIIPVYIIYPVALWSLLLLIISWLWAYLKFKDAGFLLKDKQLKIRKRNIARLTSFTKKEHIQSLYIKQNIFQRISKLATLEIFVLSSPSAVKYTVKDLDMNDAQAVLSWTRPRRNKEVKES